jgi:riboflavin kinase/FMN adenylyltransferase
LTIFARLISSGPTILTIGNFDGMHRGHQALLRSRCSAWPKQIAATRKTSVNTAFLTFDPHPVRVLRPDIAAFSADDADGTA